MNLKTSLNITISYFCNENNGFPTKLKFLIHQGETVIIKIAMSFKFYPPVWIFLIYEPKNARDDKKKIVACQIAKTNVMP